jgi:hypothetical protein
VHVIHDNMINNKLLGMLENLRTSIVKNEFMQSNYLTGCYVPNFANVIERFNAKRLYSVINWFCVKRLV